MSPEQRALFAVDEVSPYEGTAARERRLLQGLSSASMRSEVQATPASVDAEGAVAGAESGSDVPRSNDQQYPPRVYDIEIIG